jgi:hypothetical protein
MPYMTDTGRAASILNWAFDGASAITITQPYHLRLMTAMGSGNANVNGSNGTEATGSNCPGYTALGSTLGASAPFGSFSSSSPSGTSANAVTWNATGTWTTVVGVEIWDTAGTALRWLIGTLTANITGVVNGDTVQFAAGAITVNATAW